MSSDLVGDSDTTTEQPGDTLDATALRTQIELLEDENQRLREEYARARQQQYRRSALGLAGLGAAAALGGVLFPTAGSVLFALAGTGLFLGVLIFYLSPEQFVPASIGRTVYSSLARNEADIVAELGLRDDRLYIPTETGDVRLFVPQHEDFQIPDGDALDDAFVVTSDPSARGLALEPTGDGLADEFEQAVTGSVADDPATLAGQVCDALVEQFELVETATPDVDPTGGRVTVAVGESAFGAVTRFDHPVVSVLASALARTVDEPVRTDVREADDERVDYRITVTWDEDSETDDGESADENADDEVEN